MGLHWREGGGDRARLAVLALLVALASTALSSTALANHSIIERISVGQIGGSGNATARFAGATPDGAHVFFETQESLVAGDADSRFDVYERSDGVTSLVSAGRTGGNGAFDSGFEGASPDGVHVFFSTTERSSQTTPTANPTSTNISVE